MLFGRNSCTQGIATSRKLLSEKGETQAHTDECASTAFLVPACNLPNKNYFVFYSKFISLTTRNFHSIGRVNGQRRYLQIFITGNWNAFKEESIWMYIRSYRNFKGNITSYWMNNFIMGLCRANYRDLYFYEGSFKLFLVSFIEWDDKCILYACEPRFSCLIQNSTFQDLQKPSSAFGKLSTYKVYLLL